MSQKITLAELHRTMEAFATSHPEGRRCTPYRQFIDCCTEWFGNSGDGDTVLDAEFVDYWMDVITGVTDLDADNPPNWSHPTEDK
jgi:hypothetical protein